MLGECLDPGRVEIVVLDCSVFNIRYQLTEFLEYPHFEQMISSDHSCVLSWAGDGEADGWEGQLGDDRQEVTWQQRVTSNKEAICNTHWRFCS